MPKPTIRELVEAVQDSCVKEQEPGLEVPEARGQEFQVRVQLGIDDEVMWRKEDVEKRVREILENEFVLLSIEAREY